MKDVPPWVFLLDTELSMFRIGIRSSSLEGMSSFHSSRVRLRRVLFLSRHHRTASPTCSWAVLKGTPFMTRYSATSVARVKPSEKASAALSASISTRAMSWGSTSRTSLTIWADDQRARLSSCMSLL